MNLFILALIMAGLFAAAVSLILWALGVLEFECKRVEGDEQ